MVINENHKRAVEGRGYIYIGTYEKNENLIDSNRIKPYKITYIRVQCPYCDKEYDIQRGSFLRGANCINCCNSYENSVAYHIEKILKINLEQIIDVKSCKKHPKYIYRSSKKYIYLWWEDKYKKHSYKISCNKFTLTNNPKSRRSFADWLIDNYGEDALELYWSDKNAENPWEIDFKSTKKYWFKCQEKKYHEDYKCSLDNFVDKGSRCPYCSKNSGKVHPRDSFGANFPYYIKYWSKNNKKSPFEISPYNGKKYKFICERCGKEFNRIIGVIVKNNNGCCCPTCTSSKGEHRVKLWLDKNCIEYIPQKTFYDLRGLKGGLLSYDFYLPSFNLLIEYQGEQHKKGMRFWDDSMYERQLEHDRRKREYAKIHNIKLLEIWYYDEDNIECILEEKIGCLK